MGFRNVLLFTLAITLCLQNVLADDKPHTDAPKAPNATAVAAESDVEKLVPTISNRCPGAIAENQPLTSDPSAVPVFLNFNGKGIHAPWDVGVVKAALEDFPALKGPNVQLGGNSSGSLLAAYFACWGVNSQSVAELEKIFANKDGGKEFDFKVINSSTAAKKRSLYFQQATERPHADIEPLIHKVIYRNGEKCKLDPKTPLIIGAANRDVIDARIFNKLDKNGDKIMHEVEVLNEKGEPVLNEKGEPVTRTEPLIMSGPALKAYDAKGKQYDPKTNSVSRDGKNLGKACTHFVTRASYEQLSKIPYSERECELRIIDSNDLELALLASVAEPTYFETVTEKDPSKILSSGVTQPEKPRETPKGEIDQQNDNVRQYVGGFLNSGLAIDAKKQNPAMYVLSTGVTPFSPAMEGVLGGWFMVNPSRRLEEGKKVVDLEVLPEIDWDGDKESDSHALYVSGYHHAKEAFAKRAKDCKGAIIPTPSTIIKTESTMP